MKLSIVKTTRTTPDSITLHFEKPQRLSYQAGQHGIFNFTIDGEIVSRTYSFSSSPQDNGLSITVKKVAGGQVSTCLTTHNIDSVELDQVTGDFYLTPSPEHQRHLVMLAGGSGITPIISMIRTALYAEPQSSISLIFVNRSFEQIIFREELDALAVQHPKRLNIYHILTQEPTVTHDYPVFYQDRPSKLILKKLVRSITNEITDRIEYFMCGPYGLMQLFDETLQTLSVDQSMIHREHFFIPSDDDQDILLSNLPAREVILEHQGEEKLITVNGGVSILQAALSQTIRLPHSCTKGQCGVCRALLVNGNVNMRRNHILTEEELASGQILLCQSFPVTDDVVVRPIN